SGKSVSDTLTKPVHFVSARKAPGSVLGNVCGRLLEKFRHHDAHGAIGELLDMVEKLSVTEQRQ
ncbi:hypothetical protein ACC723_38100, partial [Rhizobium ruizarguesonis]